MSARPRRAPAPARSRVPARRPRRAAGTLALALALACVPLAPSFAQQSTGGQSMTLEELEAYIAEQRAALERVEENREITREKERRVREQLERREARRQELEDELETLCQERASVAADASDVDSAEQCEPDPTG